MPTTMFRADKPKTPNYGELYMDTTTGIGHIWLGNNWVEISAYPDMTPTPRDLAPTMEQLDEHPALKNAWEEYLVVKRLLGL